MTVMTMHADWHKHLKNAPHLLVLEVPASNLMSPTVACNVANLLGNNVLIVVGATRKCPAGAVHLAMPCSLTPCGPFSVPHWTSANIQSCSVPSPQY